MHPLSSEGFVNGKEQGMIMVLSGSLDVCKSFNTNSVTEPLLHSLYKLGAGDLDTDTYRVDGQPR
jgi:hypothetical protein